MPTKLEGAVRGPGGAAGFIVTFADTDDDASRRESIVMLLGAALKDVIQDCNVNGNEPVSIVIEWRGRDEQH